jgi:hypothetical protein
VPLLPETSEKALPTPCRAGSLKAPAESVVTLAQLEQRDHRWPNRRPVA